MFIKSLKDLKKVTEKTYEFEFVRGGEKVKFRYRRVNSTDWQVIMDRNPRPEPKIEEVPIEDKAEQLRVQSKFKTIIHDDNPEYLKKLADNGYNLAKDMVALCVVIDGMPEQLSKRVAILEKLFSHPDIFNDLVQLIYIPSEVHYEEHLEEAVKNSVQETKGDED